jgi:hypothetical protein
MQHVTRDEFLELLGITSGVFDQLQFAGHVALAFGTPLPATPGRYLDCDLVGMAISLGLTRSVGRENATAIVATCWPQWMNAIGCAEADPQQDYFIAVGGIGWDSENKGPKSFLVTNGTLGKIAEDFQNGGVGDYWGVNISDIIRRLRTCAEATGIDLSKPFFYPQGDPRFDEILTTRIKRELESRLARLKKDKKKSAAMRARSRREDIAVVRDEQYQFGS